MAKKLKTLKDARHPTYTYDDVDYDTDFDAVYVDDLKTFAREWYDIISNREFPDNVKDWSEEPIEEWIKHFFDLDGDDENEN